MKGPFIANIGNNENLRNYVHTMWHNYTATAKHNEQKIDKALIDLRNNLIKFIDIELRQYKNWETQFINLVKKNKLELNKEIKTENLKVTRSSILKEYRKAYLDEEGEEFKNLRLAKEAFIDIGKLYWTKNDRNNKVTIQFTEKDRKRYIKRLTTIGEGLEAIGDLLQNDLTRKQENVKTTDMNKKIQDLKKDLDKDKMNDLKKLINLAINNPSDENITIISKQLVELFKKAKTSLESQIGFMAEKSQADIINNKLAFFLNAKAPQNKKAKVVGDIFAKENVVDVLVANLEQANGKNLIIGVNQKFRKLEKYSSTYSITNYDLFYGKGVYKELNAYSGKLDKDTESLFLYMRRNFLMLTYGFSYPDGFKTTGAIEKYRKTEIDLALLRGFTRFFGGFMVAQKDGTLTPIQKNYEGYENSDIYNAFIATRQNIYWTYDFLKEIRKVLETTGTNNKAWSNKANLLTGEVSDKNYGAGSLKRMGMDLWNAKRKFMRRNPSEINYENLYKAVESNLNDIAKATNRPLASSVRYTLQPSKLNK